MAHVTYKEGVKAVTPGQFVFSMMEMFASVVVL